MTQVQVVNLRLSPPPLRSCLSSINNKESSSSKTILRFNHSSNVDHIWDSLQRQFTSKPRLRCLFSGNNKHEQAKKALESALGGKKSEYEKWDKEMTKKEEAGGGDGDSGSGGGWFRWGGWSGDDWLEAQRTCLTILGLFVMYLVVAKGDVIFAVIFNPLLFALRGTRNGLTFATSRILKMVSPNTKYNTQPVANEYTHISAKESVVKKWGSD